MEGMHPMNVKDAIYPLLAAACYSTNPVLAKLGLQISNEPLLDACIGLVASAVVYTVYFKENIHILCIFL